jgi:predicted alpha/beta-fold hydrolase
MPLIDHIKFNPGLIGRNPHMSTLYPYFFRKFKEYDFVRKREELPDGDFIDVDWLFNENSNKLAILLHGLEGSSKSQYIKGATELLYESDWNICAVNHRSCSGEMNRNLEMYHSGFTKDLKFILEKSCDHYKTIIVVGYSLGGNMALKYLGEGNDVPDSLKLVVGFSVPADLEGGSMKLKKWSNKIYNLEFLRTLKIKMGIKAKQYPQINLEYLPKLKYLCDFDEYYTAPLHGFKNALDYYSQSNCKQFLSNINGIPAFLINALDDPFLSESCQPFEIAKQSLYFHFIPLQYGGHVGFTTKEKGVFKSDILLDKIVREYI